MTSFYSPHQELLRSIKGLLSFAITLPVDWQAIRCIAEVLVIICDRELAEQKNSEEICTTPKS